MALPSACIGDDEVASDAEIQETKLKHRVVCHYAQAGGADVVNGEEIVYIMQADGALLAVEVFPETAPTSSDSYEVDVLRSTDGGSFTSMLSAVVTIDSGNSNRTLDVTGTAAISGGGTLVAGDAVKIKLQNATSGGNEGQGVCVTIKIRENGV